MLEAEACVAATAARRAVGGFSCMLVSVGRCCFFDRFAYLSAAEAVEKRDGRVWDSDMSQLRRIPWIGSYGCK
jgi:hypothetical protein